MFAHPVGMANPAAALAESAGLTLKSQDPLHHSNAVALGRTEIHELMGPPDRGHHRAFDPLDGRGLLLQLANQAVHQLDLFQWFMGPIAEVYGAWANFNHPTIEVEDTAVAMLRFQNGALGSILLSNSQKPGLFAKIHVHGHSGASVGVQTEGGSVFIAGIPMQVEPAVNDLWTIPGEAQFLDEWTREDRARGDIVEIVSHYHYLQIQDFLKAIQENRPPLVDGIEGRRSVELFTAIYRSQAAHAPISFPLH